MPELKEFSEKVILAINSGKVSSKKELNKFKFLIARELGLKEFPSNPTILSFAKNKTPKLKNLLSIKPTRSLSGVSVVALMAKPFPCPGKCVYCPSGIGVETPKSYTGKEPATMRAIANNFDPAQQIKNRLLQLQETGHSTEKVELIVMGGTFLSTPLPYQKSFVKKCFEAVSAKKAVSLQQAQKNSEHSKNRVVGLTFETRPDFCGKKEINRMLSFGGTRVELGVQQIDDEIYKKIKRGHSVQDVIDSTAFLKDSAFKLAYHLIPGLPGSSPAKDLKLFKKLFSDPCFCPDMLKIYPCLVIQGTELYKDFVKGKYVPISSKKAAKLIAKMKALVPRYVRIMRVQRDIPSNVIFAGVDKSNLREFAQKEMLSAGTKCNCIRCREIGLKSRKQGSLPLIKEPRLFVESYKASNGLEHFISFEDSKRNYLLGFCRLRFPFKPFRREISRKTAVVRELHVYSKSLPLGEKPFDSEFQHRGLGKKLLEEAERLAREQGFNELLVISGIGVKEYYRNLGFKDSGPFVSKPLI